MASKNGKGGKPDDAPVVTETMKDAQEAKDASDERAGLHDSGDDPKMSRGKPKVDYSTEYAYQQGQNAARNAIGKDDCPHGDGPDREAWLAGWKQARHG